MAPDLHGDDPEQCVEVGPASGSPDESDGLVPGVEDVAPIFMDQTDLFALSPVVPVSREAEQYLELFPDEVSSESDKAAPVLTNPCPRRSTANMFLGRWRRTYMAMILNSAWELDLPAVTAHSNGD